MESGSVRLKMTSRFCGKCGGWMVNSEEEPDLWKCELCDNEIGMTKDQLMKKKKRRELQEKFKKDFKREKLSTDEMKELLVCKQCGAVLSSDYAFCDKCGSKLQNKNIIQYIKIEKVENKRTLLKEKGELQKMFEEKKVLYLKGCLMCGSSKVKKIKKSSYIVEHVQTRKWTDSHSHTWDPPLPRKTQKMYKIMYGCRQCGHIWIECTKYRFKRI